MKGVIGLPLGHLWAEGSPAAGLKNLRSTAMPAYSASPYRLQDPRGLSNSPRVTRQTHHGRRNSLEQRCVTTCYKGANQELCFSASSCALQPNYANPGLSQDRQVITSSLRTHGIQPDGIALDRLVMYLMQKQEQQHLTPEQLRAMKGPSSDDPVEAEGAASWVQQFNEELAAPSRNALECEQCFLLHVQLQWMSGLPCGDVAQGNCHPFICERHHGQGNFWRLHPASAPADAMLSLSRRVRSENNDLAQMTCKLWKRPAG